MDAIWLSPIYLSTRHDFGYDVADYYIIHPMFCTMAEFDRLLAETTKLDREGNVNLADFSLRANEGCIIEL